MMMKLINLVIPPAPAPPQYGPATNRSRSGSSRMQPPLLSAQGRDKLNMRSLEILNFYINVYTLFGEGVHQQLKGLPQYKNQF